jgi:Flp pilus assembly protein TadG
MIYRPRRLNDHGIGTVMVAIMLVLMLSFIGLAIDLGRIYVVRSALGTAVDGASLAAARLINTGSGPAITAAKRTFDADFPSGFLGTTNVTKDVQLSLAPDGSDLITVKGTATLPTLFMHIVGTDQFDVKSGGQATRRLIDMAFVIDRSGSLANPPGTFPTVQTASNNFISLFDRVNDRIALVSFSTNTIVHDAITLPGRGFNLGSLQGHVNGLAADGSTATSDALYQAWDQLRLVPFNNQSGLRVIVLFTDGTPNTWPGTFQVRQTCTGGTGGNPCVPGGGFVPVTGMLSTNDYPAAVGQDNPAVWGLVDPHNALDNVFLAPTVPTRWTSGTNFIKTTVNPGIPTLPASNQSTETPIYGSAGIPTTFPLYDNTIAQGASAQRPMIGAAPYPDHVQNANDAARNLMEIIANAIRTDGTGKAPIHIYTLGLGHDLTVGSGSNLELGSTMLQRIANDPASADYNPNQPDGGYFFAGSVAQLGAAFQAIRDRIIRITH